MKTPICLIIFTLALGACSSKPAQIQATEGALEGKPTPAVAKAPGPLSFYLGDTMAASVDADGRFLAGTQAPARPCGSRTMGSS